MDLERRRPVPPPPPKRALLPRARPNFDGMEPVEGAAAESNFQNSFVLLEILQESREPQSTPLKREEKTSEAKVIIPDLEPTSLPTPPISQIASANLRFPWAFWSLLLAFCALAGGLYYVTTTMGSANSSAYSTTQKRDLEKTKSFPDPNPTTEASGQGDPIPGLKPPTKPSRD